MDEMVLWVFIIALLFLLVPLITLIKLNLLQQGMRRLEEQQKKDARLLQEIKEELEGLDQLPVKRVAQAAAEKAVAETIFTQQMEPEKADIPEPESGPLPGYIVTEREIEPEFLSQEIQPEPITYIESREVMTESDVPDKEPVKPLKEEAEIKPRKLQQPVKPAKKVNPFEKISFESLLPKIGIITLVLGVAFFVKYAIDQDWINEVGRVGIGLLVGAGLIGIGHKLRKHYDVFSSLLAGGGIAVFYITITIAFREYLLFNAAIAFIFLIAITIFAVLLSLLYDKIELAVFSLLGGFLSPYLASTGSGNYIVLFSYIALLNTGMLAITLRKDWRLIGIISFWLTQLWVWLWLWNSFTVQYTAAAIFIGIFFFQFYMLALIDHFRNPEKVTPYQVFLILGNNLMIFAAYLFIFKGLAFKTQGLITILMALVNAVFMIILFRRKHIDNRLIYLLIAIVLGFVSLAVPLQLDGNAITLFWVAEMVILLMLWQKSRIKVFRAGFIILLGLIAISYLMDIEKGYMSSHYLSDYPVLPVIVNRYFITGLGVIAGLFLSWKMAKRDTEWQMPGLNRLLKYMLIGTIFLVPYLELNHHIEYYVDSPENGWSVFRYVAMLTYTFSFLAGLAYYYRHSSANSKRFFWVMLGAVGAYVLLYTYQAVNLRYVVYYKAALSPAYFAVHLLSLPAIGYLVCRMLRSVRHTGFPNPGRLIWVITVISVIILTVETDHLAIMFFSTPEKYSGVLYDVHTFVYPIVWGIIAMTLMLWGLKKKELVLRKISLVFFALIIGKIYLYDVWRMSQGGRIVSFVILGVILLLVSFMQQKIRTLVKQETPEQVKEEIKDENE